MGIPGGTCEFDLPAYFAWQNATHTRRREDLHRWSETLTPLANAIYLLLKILRDSGTAQKVVANQGQFQQNLPQGKPYQLLRMRIHAHLGLIPEISGNRLIVLIRLMRQEAGDRLHTCVDDATFELTLCS
jgi:cell division protein ZapD